MKLLFQWQNAFLMTWLRYIAAAAQNEENTNFWYSNSYTQRAFDAAIALVNKVHHVRATYSIGVHALSEHFCVMMLFSDYAKNPM